MTDNLERALQERLLARSQVSPRDVEALRLFARTLPARRSIWQRPAFGWGLAGAAVALAAVVALPQLLGPIPGPGATPSPTPEPTQPAPPQSAPPIGPAPTPSPTVVGGIPLLTASGSDVTVVIDDPDGLIAGAESGQGEATMSVRWYEAMVEDGPTPNSVILTWVGFPRDEVVRAQASRSPDGHLVLHIEQDNPPLNSDGLGEDRVLILELSDEIDRADFQVTFETNQ